MSITPDAGRIEAIVSHRLDAIAVLVTQLAHDRAEWRSRALAAEGLLERLNPRFYDEYMHARRVAERAEAEDKPAD